MVRLEADGPALLQDGLVGGVQPLAHHRDGVVVVIIACLLVVVSIVVVLLLVSQ